MSRRLATRASRNQGVGSDIKSGELYEEFFGLPDDDLTARSDLCSNDTVWRALCVSVREFLLAGVPRRAGRG